MENLPEILLKAKEAQLFELEKKAKNLYGEDRDQFLVDVQKQQSFIRDEILIREVYRRESEALLAIKKYETIKTELLQTKAQRVLTLAEQATHAKSLKDVAVALAAAGVNPIPSSVGEAHKTVLAKQAETQAKFMDLKNKSEPFFRQFDGVGDPCVPCMEKRLNIIEKNVWHRQRAATSKAAFRGQQTNKDTCALMSLASIQLEHAGKALPEGWSINNRAPTLGEFARTAVGKDDLIDFGEGVLKSDGTPAYTACNGTSDPSALMTSAGYKATGSYGATLDEYASDLDKGKAVIVGYDARPVWYGSDPVRWEKVVADHPKPMGHAVRVTGVVRSMDGSVKGFFINDSGDGTSGKYVPAATFQKALDEFYGGMKNSTDASVFPSFPN